MQFMITYSFGPEVRDEAQARFKKTGGLPEFDVIPATELPHPRVPGAMAGLPRRVSVGWPVGVVSP